MIRFPRIGYEFLRTYSKAKRNGKYPKHIFLLAGTMNVHCTCMSTLATCTVKVPVFFLTLFFSEIIIGFLFNALFLRNNYEIHTTMYKRYRFNYNFKQSPSQGSIVKQLVQYYQIDTNLQNEDLSLFLDSPGVRIRLLDLTNA